DQGIVAAGNRFQAVDRRPRRFDRPVRPRWTPLAIDPTVPDGGSPCFGTLAGIIAGVSRQSIGRSLRRSRSAGGGLSLSQIVAARSPLEQIFGRRAKVVRSIDAARRSAGNLPVANAVAGKGRRRSF